MFGWEFPPNISGGLGTACFGLTKGLSQLAGVDLTFVVPKIFGGEDRSNCELLSACDVPVKYDRIKEFEYGKEIEYCEVDSKLVPYTDPKSYLQAKSSLFKKDSNYLNTLEFSGKYTLDLFSEIQKYALVADSIARNREFDVIHAHDWLTFPAGISAKNASGKPLIVHVHATDFDRCSSEINPKVYNIEKQGMDAADKIITVSNFTKQIVIERYHINPAKVKTIYNAVEPVKFDCVSSKKRFKEKLVTFMGRITSQKGPEYFVEAASRVLRLMENVRFVMAGSGDLMNKMVSRVAQLGIADKFYFAGFLKGDDVFRLLKMSDLYVMPSVSEPFGICPLEAMQAGVPVIISKQSGVSEILSNVIQIDYWDFDALANSIMRVLTNNKFSAMLARKGKIESGKLKWIDSAIQVLQVYKSVA